MQYSIDELFDTYRHLVSHIAVQKYYEVMGEGVPLSPIAPRVLCASLAVRSMGSEIDNITPYFTTRR
jgi:hypothetical protein